MAASPAFAVKEGQKVLYVSPVFDDASGEVARFRAAVGTQGSLTALARTSIDAAGPLPLLPFDFFFKNKKIFT